MLVTEERVSKMEEQAVSVDHVYISLTEASFRYNLLHEISVVVFSLHQDDMYTKEEAMKDLLRLMHTIQLDMPSLPTADDISA